MKLIEQLILFPGKVELADVKLIVDERKLDIETAEIHFRKHEAAELKNAKEALADFAKTGDLKPYIEALVRLESAQIGSVAVQKAKEALFAEVK